MKRDLSKLPFKVKYSIAPIIYELEKSDNYFGEFKAFIDYIKDTYPLLLNGFESIEEFEKSLDEINPILEKVIPQAIMKNTLRAISFPLIDNKFYFKTPALKEIIDKKDAKVYSFYENFSDENFYKICCCLILSKYYNVNLDLDQTELLEVDNGKGYLTYLTAIYSFDYFEIKPFDPKFELTEEQIDKLLNNYENTNLWREYIPMQAWEVKGVSFTTFFDNTKNIAISNLKTKLLSYKKDPNQVSEDIINSFKSIFSLSDLNVGFSTLNNDFSSIVDFPINSATNSFMLYNCKQLNVDNIFCINVLKKLKNTDYFVISNVDAYRNKYPNDELIINLYNQGIKSLILYPLTKNGEYLGNLEIVSGQPNVFNRINANQIREVLPLIEESLYRFFMELDHQINSYIQSEYTSLHPSVEWKFKNKAKETLLNPNSSEKDLEIYFNDVYPIYGEVDVRNSSFFRNKCMKADYENQLVYLIGVCEELFLRSSDEKFENYIKKLKYFLERVNNVNMIYFEREIFDFISIHVHPEIPKFIKEDENSIILDYLNKLDSHTGLFDVERKKFDNAIYNINQLLSNKMDIFQADAQLIFPHYYERFKTDGIDYNLYIGKSISPTLPFSYHVIKEIRFWQLQAMIALEQSYYDFKKKELSIDINVASLIISINSPINIRFKLDEKRFDADGYDNAKYEIIKKRVNKANVKGSSERINVPGKLCIIYVDEVLKEEYTAYLRVLISRGYLLDDIEYLEVEELQGLSGLLAIRVSINYDVPITKYEKIDFM